MVEVVQPWDFYADALGDVLTGGGALIGKACSLAYGTTEGLFRGFKGFLEELI